MEGTPDWPLFLRVNIEHLHRIDKVSAQNNVLGDSVNLGITFLTCRHCRKLQGEGFEVQGQGGEHRTAERKAMVLASNTMRAMMRPPVLRRQYRKLRALEA